MASLLSFLRRYSVPLVLFGLGLFFQLVLLPSSYPRSHYEVLGVRHLATIEEVTEAYEKISLKWASGANPITAEFVDVRYAFELLTNPTWKRDYDLYGVDEHLDVVEKTKAQYDGQSFSNVKLPLLDAAIFGQFEGSADHAFNPLTPKEFASLIGGTKAVLIQVYSSGSHRCAKFLNSWKRIGSMLDGVADVGMLEVGEVQVVPFMAERKFNRPFFRNGLPDLVAFPPYCKSFDCLVRYQGDLSTDAVVDWIATSILGLPRIPYYSRDTLGPNFIGKTALHKVKVIGFSKTGERAPPFMRQAVRDYQAYASFAFVLWREEESSLWWNTFGVDTAPAVVFLKDPGLEPTIYQGNLNSSYFEKLMEENKYFVLPQLRSSTSMELGCDARGYSRGGNNLVSWYCVILVGRPSLELNKMRETIRRAQNLLAHDFDPERAEKISVPAPAIDALKEKRLTFVWLDGELQKDYCLFYLHSDTIYETCGPRRDLANVPRVFIVRYKRTSKVDDLNSVKNPKKKNIWKTFHEEDENKASQLVAKYNGTEDLQEIISWISQIIEDGDTRNLPDFTVSTPELLPEEGDRIWSKGTQNIVSSSKGIVQKFQNAIMNIPDYVTDPRVGPFMLLCACLSFGAIWFQSSSSPQKISPSEEAVGKEKPRNHRRRREATSNKERPPSITDTEPRDAYQWSASDTNSE
ncbi:Protein-disulfide reductase protein [Dioscorea alata]|uniref:Protein-disulfide reductase protein n=1 Tax=Dioscorea alata TaxID=55571 RepID=A0ACB7U7W1_DIOAL|nr:Protein-disulfide reductase protein [Dioscorea alata]